MNCKLYLSLASCTNSILLMLLAQDILAQSSLPSLHKEPFSVSTSTLFFSNILGKPSVTQSIAIQIRPELLDPMTVYFGYGLSQKNFPGTVYAIAYPNLGIVPDSLTLTTALSTGGIYYGGWDFSLRFFQTKTKRQLIYGSLGMGIIGFAPGYKEADLTIDRSRYFLSSPSGFAGLFGSAGLGYAFEFDHVVPFFIELKYNLTSWNASLGDLAPFWEFKAGVIFPRFNRYREHIKQSIRYTTLR